MAVDPNAVAAFRLAQQANQTAAAQGAAIAQINRAVSDLTEVLTKDRLSEEHTRLAKALEKDVEDGKITREEAVVRVAEAVADARARLNKPAQSSQPQRQPQPPQAQPNPMQIGTQAILASYKLNGNEPGLQLDTTNPEAFRQSIEKFLENRQKTPTAGDKPGEEKNMDVEAIRAQERKKLAEEYGIPLRDGGGVAAAAVAAPVSSDDIHDIALRYNNRFHTKGQLSRGKLLERLQEARDQIAGKVGEVTTGEKAYAATPENLARIAAGGNPK